MHHSLLLRDTGKSRRKLSYRQRVPAADTMPQTVSCERDDPPEQIDQKQFDYQAEDAAIAW